MRLEYFSKVFSCFGPVIFMNPVNAYLQSLKLEEINGVLFRVPGYSP
jgi:hypothetical protein